MEDYEEYYEKYWKDIIEKGGKINLDQVKRELFDYSFLMDQASKVYCEVTNGLLSKTTYFADTIIAEYEDDLTKWVCEAIEDYKKEQQEKFELLKKEYCQDIPPEFKKVFNEHWEELLA
jgi:hypothetical protein